MKVIVNTLSIRIIFIILSIAIFQNSFSQSLKADNDTINQKRLNTVVFTYSGLYAITLTTLYFGWYKDTPLTSFHFINDMQADLAIDKAGHATTAYIMSFYSFNMLRWAGVDNNKSAIWGSLMGFTSMTVIEILDGFSAEYGSSWPDLIANGVGSGLFLGQQLGWKEQRFQLKYSYYPSEFAQYNPELLGKNHMQRMLKDYNGHTYWLSGNIHSFLPEESKFPKWINVAVGYGGKGIIGAWGNPNIIDGKPVPQFERVRQYYISMDLDWTRIKTNSKFLKVSFKILSLFKIPFPTLEYNNKDGFVFHPIYM